MRADDMQSITHVKNLDSKLSLHADKSAKSERCKCVY
jgi:hypothetical protein